MHETNKKGSEESALPQPPINLFAFMKPPGDRSNTVVPPFMRKKDPTQMPKLDHENVLDKPMMTKRRRNRTIVKDEFGSDDEEAPS